MAWKPKTAEDWRKFLTAEERAALDRADKAKEAWLALPRPGEHQNRAIQRAKHAAGAAK